MGASAVLRIPARPAAVRYHIFCASLAVCFQTRPGTVTRILPAPRRRLWYISDAFLLLVQPTESARVIDAIRGFQRAKTKFSRGSRGERKREGMREVAKPPRWSFSLPSSGHID